MEFAVLRCRTGTADEPLPYILSPSEIDRVLERHGLTKPSDDASAPTKKSESMAVDA